MSLVLAAIQLILCAVFLLAGTGKVLHSDEFSTALRLSRLPDRVVAPAGVLVPALEFGVAAGLVLQTSRSLLVALGVAVVVLTAFTAWMVWVYARGLRVRCGCFGHASTVVGPRGIERNLVLLGLALVGLLLAWRTSSPLPGPSLWMGITITATGLCAALLIALRMALPALVLNLDPVNRGSRPQGGE